MASIQRIHRHLLPFPPIRVEPLPGTTDEVSQHASPVHLKKSQHLTVSGRRSPRLGVLLLPTRPLIAKGYSLISLQHVIDD